MTNGCWVPALLYTAPDTLYRFLTTFYFSALCPCPVRGAAFFTYLSNQLIIS
jgi:hypothetical protein